MELPSIEQIKFMYKKMLIARLFEEKVAYFFSRAMIHGTTHLAVGQEASAIGATASLLKDDFMISTHRGHAHSIGRGMSVSLMMCEMFGRANGYCKGKGGSMHIADISSNNLGANGIVGGGIPIAVGAGLSIKMQTQNTESCNRVVLCFFGDGATNEGAFHEALNLASIWNLPIIFFCENNQYGMSMPQSKSMNIKNITIRASSYGMKSINIDGNDLLAVYEASCEAREYACKNGAILLVSDTYRTKGHSKSDANRYRTREEIAQWEKQDPIVKTYNHLFSERKISIDELKELERQAEAIIEDAVNIAENSPQPDMDSVIKDVYAP